MTAFKLLGAALVIYVAYALAYGRVYARHGVWGKSYSRDDDPWSYWSSIVVYVGLAVALLFIF
jgi:hypothetical protein